MNITNTPWGRPDRVDVIADGIACVYTPSHGGIVLSDARAAKIPAGIRPWTSDPRFWEEDCDWAVPYLVFTDDFANWECVKRIGRADMIKIAMTTLGWRKDDALKLLNLEVAA